MKSFIIEFIVKHPKASQKVLELFKQFLNLGKEKKTVPKTVPSKQKNDVNT